MIRLPKLLPKTGVELFSQVSPLDYFTLRFFILFLLKDGYNGS